MSSGSDNKASQPSRQRKLASTQGKNRPAFVGKLWQMINDPANDPYLRWMPDGKSIQVVNREAFEKNVLPQYFKHANFSSFVRQLNMYGWHKVQDLNSGSMQSSDEHWQFQSPNFVKGHEELLDNIVRNKGHKQADEEDERSDLSQVLHELESIKNKQILIGEDLFRMHKDNEMLWNEYYQTRERYDKHSQLLDRILQFMASVYGNQTGKMLDTASTGINPASKRRLLTQEPDSSMNLANLLDGITSPKDRIKELQDQLSKEDLASDAKISTVLQSPDSTASRSPPELSNVSTPRPSTSAAVPPHTAPATSAATPIKQEDLNTPGFDAAASGLFPELGLDQKQYRLPWNESDRAVQMAPPDLGKQIQYSNQELDRLSEQLAVQDSSLQQVQDWISRMSPNGDYGTDDSNFDVSDFIVETPDADAEADPAKLLSEGQKLNK